VGITELSNKLCIDKSVVSRLAKKGMPTHSVDAAQAWREEHAKPRAKRGQAGTPPPPPVKITIPKPPPPQREAAPNCEISQKPQPTPEPPPQPEQPEPEPTPSADPADEQENELAASMASLQFARVVEKVAKNELAKCSRSPHSTVEDFRKATATCIAARANAEKARQDRARFLRDQRITLYLSEAELIFGKAHQLVATMLAGMPKQIAPRLVGQPQREVERTLADWVDEVMGAIRTNL